MASSAAADGVKKKLDFTAGHRDGNPAGGDTSFLRMRQHIDRIRSKHSTDSLVDVLMDNKGGQHPNQTPRTLISNLATRKPKENSPPAMHDSFAVFRRNPGEGRDTSGLSEQTPRGLIKALRPKPSDSNHLENSTATADRLRQRLEQMNSKDAPAVHTVPSRTLKDKSNTNTSVHIHDSIEQSPLYMPAPRRSASPPLQELSMRPHGQSPKSGGSPRGKGSPRRKEILVERMVASDLADGPVVVDILESRAHQRQALPTASKAAAKWLRIARNKSPEKSKNDVKAEAFRNFQERKAKRDLKAAWMAWVLDARERSALKAFVITDRENRRMVSDMETFKSQVAALAKEKDQKLQEQRKQLEFLGDAHEKSSEFERLYQEVSAYARRLEVDKANAEAQHKKYVAYLEEKLVAKSVEADEAQLAARMKLDYSIFRAKENIERKVMAGWVASAGAEQRFGDAVATAFTLRRGRMWLRKWRSLTRRGRAEAFLKAMALSPMEQYRILGRLHIMVCKRSAIRRWREQMAERETMRRVALRLRMHPVRKALEEFKYCLGVRKVKAKLRARSCMVAKSKAMSSWKAWAEGCTARKEVGALRRSLMGMCRDHGVTPDMVASPPKTRFEYVNSQIADKSSKTIAGHMYRYVDKLSGILAQKEEVSILDATRIQEELMTEREKSLELEGRVRDLEAELQQTKQSLVDQEQKTRLELMTSVTMARRERDAAVHNQEEARDKATEVMARAESLAQKAAKEKDRLQILVAELEAKMLSQQQQHEATLMELRESAANDLQEYTVKIAHLREESNEYKEETQKERMELLEYIMKLEKTVATQSSNVIESATDAVMSKEVVENVLQGHVTADAFSFWRGYATENACHRNILRTLPRRNMMLAIQRGFARWTEMARALRRHRGIESRSHRKRVGSTLDIVRRMLNRWYRRTQRTRARAQKDLIVSLKHHYGEISGSINQTASVATPLRGPVGQPPVIPHTPASMISSIGDDLEGLETPMLDRIQQEAENEYNSKNYRLMRGRVNALDSGLVTACSRYDNLQVAMGEVSSGVAALEGLLSRGRSDIVETLDDISNFNISLQARPSIEPTAAAAPRSSLADMSVANALEIMVPGVGDSIAEGDLPLLVDIVQREVREAIREREELDGVSDARQVREETYRTFGDRVEEIDTSGAGSEQSTTQNT